jgi:hypothetical protein
MSNEEKTLAEVAAEAYAASWAGATSSLTWHNVQKAVIEEWQRRNVEPVAWMQIGIGAHDGMRAVRLNAPNGYNPDWWRFEPLYTATQLPTAQSECGCEQCDTARRSKLSGGDQLQRNMIVCERCGNKRCPHATYHGLECTGSNEPGQFGSSYDVQLPSRDDIFVVIVDSESPEEATQAVLDLMKGKES